MLEIDKKSIDRARGYELVNFCESDRFAIKSYCAIHGVDESLNLGDITKVDENNLKPFNMICGGSPCFPAGTYITTDKGDIPIEDIKEGDTVLTHRGDYKKVISSKMTGYKPIFRLTTMHSQVMCTYDHRFLTVSRYDDEKYGWTEFRELRLGDFVRCFTGSKFEHCAVIGLNLESSNPVPVYDLEVADDHSFIANGFVVHNCQDFSVAGKQAGSRWKCKKCGHEYNPLTVHYAERDMCPECKSKDLDKTRSSLLVEWLRIIRANKPDWGIYENVKNIVGKKFKDTFEMFIKELNEYGYNTYYKVLNAKDFGVPQNRERVYLLIIRKEIDNGFFEFPEGFELNKRLEDVLEDEVDEKYYVDTPETRAFIKDHGSGYRIRRLTPREYFRLMGFSDEAFERARSAGVSDSQLYRQAGNSIVVDVLYHIFRDLYSVMPYLFDDLRVNSFFSGIGAFEAALDRVYADIYEGEDGMMEGSVDPI